MILLEAKDIQLYVKDRLLVKAEKLQIHKRDRIGLVGRNGSGKSTLLKFLAGRGASDQGSVNSFGSRELIPQLKTSDTTKSGGEVTQQYISKAFVNHPEILLADEPTTHLDTNHIEWVEKKLRTWQGAFVLVSHDRAFLDALCTEIWEIDDGQIKEYKGNYSDYIEQQALMRHQHEKAYENYQQKKRRLEEAMKLKEKKAAKATKAPKKVSPSEARITGAKPYFAKKQKKLEKTAKTMETRLAKLEKVDKIKDLPEIKMNLLNEANFKGKMVLRVEDVGGIIGERVLWKPASFTIKGGDKLAIIGANGSGKTTLVKKIMRQEPGVRIAPAMKIGYFSQNIDTLHKVKTILENVSSTSKQDETFIRTVLARLHFFRDDVYKPVNVLSGGERIKVALAKLFVSEINTLILDEPTNFLDLESVEALESLLQEYEGTIIFVSHDRRFIDKVAKRILAIEEEQIHLFEGTYQEYKIHIPQKQRTSIAEQKLLLETKITETLSRLSIKPSDQLETEFQKLLTQKRQLERGE